MITKQEENFKLRLQAESKHAAIVEHQWNVGTVGRTKGPPRYRGEYHTFNCILHTTESTDDCCWINRTTVRPHETRGCARAFVFLSFQSIFFILASKGSVAACIVTVSVNSSCVVFRSCSSFAGQKDLSMVCIDKKNSNEQIKIISFDLSSDIFTSSYHRGEEIIHRSKVGQDNQPWFSC